MTERGTKALIGAFVLGAVALLAVLTLLLGSGLLGDRNPTFALFFKTSLKGLVKGSPVYFKGIRIGKVKSIHIHPSLGEDTFDTPVIIEIGYTDSDSLYDDDEDVFLEDIPILDQLISRGLRARLGISSMLTGQLCVEMDMYPNADPIQPGSLPPYKGSPQIPTQLSSFDSAMAALENIPLQEVLMDIVNGIKHLGDQFDKTDISGLVSSLTATSNEARVQLQEFATVQKSLKVALASFDELAHSAKGDLASTSDKAVKTMGSYDALALSLQKDLHAATVQARSALDSTGSVITSATALLDEARKGIKEAEATFAEMRKSSRSARGVFSADSAIVIEFGQTLEALRKTAKALSDLAVLLNVKPNSLIFGRKE